MNALDVMKALLALSKKEQESIFEFWQLMQVEKTITKKAPSAKYTQKEYDRMESVFKYAIQKKDQYAKKLVRYWLMSLEEVAGRCKGQLGRI
jgi:hypothetical protein